MCSAKITCPQHFTLKDWSSSTKNLTGVQQNLLAHNKLATRLKFVVGGGKRAISAEVC
jgi:hypothetical protein